MRTHGLSFTSLSPSAVAPPAHGGFGSGPGAEGSARPVICGWCESELVRYAGNEAGPGAPISHGICGSCLAARLAVDAMSPVRSAALRPA